MAILSLALYGSRARKDNTEASDFDLFAITDNDIYQMLVQDKTNIACYPRGYAHERAEDGDLFMLHICAEAKVLYDHGEEFSKLKSIFKYKDSYGSEIEAAADIGWLLIDLWAKNRNYTFINKRSAWVVRTILIAKSAELRAPMFAAAELARFSGHEDAYELIGNKGRSEYVSSLPNKLAGFLEALNLPRKITKKAPSLIDYVRLFIATDNKMGLKTINSLQGGISDDGYA